jgi:hypothetical protein
MNLFDRREDAVAVIDILNPGERVLWEGMCASRVGRQKKAYPTVGSWNYVVLGFAALFIGVNVGAATDSRLVGVLAGGVVVVVAGLLWGTLGKHVRDSDMYCRSQTRYLITNRRAVVLRNCRTKRPLQSLSWRYVDDVRADRERFDGRGTVQFFGRDAVAGRETRPLRFFMVRNAVRVAEEARAARDAARE